jgi:hypothetical protein
VTMAYTSVKLPSCLRHSVCLTTWTDGHSEEDTKFHTWKDTNL